MYFYQSTMYLPYTKHLHDITTKFINPSLAALRDLSLQNANRPCDPEARGCFLQHICYSRDHELVLRCIRWRFEQGGTYFIIVGRSRLRPQP